MRLPIAESLQDELATPAAAVDFEPLAIASARILDAAMAAAERDPDSSRSAALQTRGMPTALVTAGSDYGETSLRILLVEDHDGIARACQRLLASHGHFIVRAPGTESALDAARQERFDLFMCDLTLPDGDGVDLLPRLRSCSSAGEPVVPAIAISGSAFPEDLERSLAAGFAAHLAKPFEAEMLLATIAEVTGHLSRRQSMSAEAPEREDRSAPSM